MQGMLSFGIYREPVLAWETPEGLAVVKPAGMHSTPGPDPDGTSLAEWVFKRYPQAAAVQGRARGEGGLIHRLDRDTEGLVLFALTEKFFEGLVSSASRGEFQKFYLARVAPGCGGLNGSRPLLSAPVGINESVWRTALRRLDLEELATLVSHSRIEGHFRPYGPGSKRVACSLAGLPSTQKAWTKDLYLTRVESAWIEESGLLVDVRLTRGFRHQIRAHLAWIGLSLEGDPLYGEGKDSIASPVERAGLKLLAYALSFREPESGRELRVTLPGLTESGTPSGAC